MSIQTPITEFYQNQTVFLTGGTGFVGKLLLVKLLQNCPTLKTIYVLIRPKYQKTPKERLEELLQNPCFSTIKSQTWKEKIVLIAGNTKQPLLGLNPDDVQKVLQTTCLFHVASNVRFDQTMKEASGNVLVTREVVGLAKQMPKLKVLLYVSTAYSTFHLEHVKEEFYEPAMKAEVLLHLVDLLDDQTLKRLTPFLLGKWPNTYVFSKSISEDLVKRAELKVPVAVVRPAIISNALEEPLAGWYDGNFGFGGVLLHALLGTCSSWYAKRHVNLDIVPVDHVCNGILAAAWKTASQNSNTVYNLVGKVLLLGQYEQLINFYYDSFPSVKYVWYRTFTARNSRLWHRISIAVHTLRMYLLQTIFFCLGNRIPIVSKYKRLVENIDLLSAWCMRNWTFDQNSVTRLREEMSEKDRNLFNFDSENIDWVPYFRSCVLGLRLHVLKDPLDTLPKGKKKVKMLLVAHYAFFLLLLVVLLLLFKVIMLAVNVTHY